MSRADSGAYFRVSSRFWTDEKVSSWPDDAKLLALYLLTCPHRTVEGLFRLPKGYAAEDLGWPTDRLEAAWAVLERDGFIAYDARAKVVLIRNALRYQAPATENHVTAAVRTLEELPRTPLLWELMRQAERYCPQLAQAIRHRFGDPPGGGEPCGANGAGEGAAPEEPRAEGDATGDAAVDAMPGAMGDAMAHGMGDAMGHGIGDSHSSQLTAHSNNPPLSPSDEGDISPQEGGDPLSSPAKGKVPPYRAIAEAWNAVCGDLLPQVRVVSEKRRQHIRARCRELEAAFGPRVYEPEFWREVFVRVRDSPFLRGENDRGWRADFDWLVGRRDAIVRVLEGRYDARAPARAEVSANGGAARRRAAAPDPGRDFSDLYIRG